MQWVLESFRAVAPESAELVIDTGKYEGTSYAYLVTRMPAQARLEEWIRTYEAGQSANLTVEPSENSVPAPGVKAVEEIPGCRASYPLRFW